MNLLRPAGVFVFVNPMTNDEHNLMTRIRERDEDAFNILVDRHQEALLRHLQRIVRDEDAAGDLVQEVFLRTWTRAEQWDGRGGVKPWLFRIGTNLALNHLRTVRRRREQPLEPPEPLGDERRQVPAWMIDTASESPDMAAERAEHAGQLRRLIDDLSPEKRDVWHLVYDADMDMAAAAETLGIPSGTVKSRMHHARKQLAREWNEIAKEWENI